MHRSNFKYEDVCRLINSSDTISFDIFDTLVSRSVLKPQDLFLDKRFGITGLSSEKYQRIRMRAERLARTGGASRGVEDTCLFKIYEQMALVIGKQSADACMDIEIDLEKKTCYPNSVGQFLYEYSLSLGKRIIAVSDMYLPADILSDILKKCGYTNISKIYVSSEIGKTKASGNIWPLVLRREQCERSSIIHIGDNRRSDFERPQECGIAAYLLSNEPFEPYYKMTKYQRRQEGMKKLAHFIESTRPPQASDAFDIGYGCLGPALVGFSLWLNRHSQEQNCEKLVFLSRDGYIIRKIYNTIFPEDIDKTTYLHASRRALIVPSLNEDASLCHVLSVMPLSTHTTVSNFLLKLGIEPESVSDWMQKCGFSADDVLITERLQQDNDFIRFYEGLQTGISMRAQSEHRALISYLTQEQLIGKHFGIVDIGWWGRMQHALCQNIAGVSDNTFVSGFYMGVRGDGVGVPRLANDCGMMGYLFSPTHDRRFSAYEDAFNGLFELFLTAPEGSVHRYVIDSKGTAHAELFENEYDGTSAAALIGDIHKGALSFARSVLYNKRLLDEEVFDSGVTFALLSSIGLNPSPSIVGTFRNVEFIDGDSYSLVPDVPYIDGHVALNQFLTDFHHSVWRPAVLQEFVRYRLPAGRLYAALLWAKAILLHYVSVSKRLLKGRRYAVSQ